MHRCHGGGGVIILPGVAAPEVCKIYLKVEAAGFADRTLFVELPVLKENDVEWGHYQRLNNYFYPGEVVSVGSLTHNDPAATENTYKSLDESICTVDEMTGELTAVASGECVVRLTATANGYLDRMIDKVVPVDTTADFGGIVWGDFPATATVGVDTAALGAPEVQNTEGNAVSGAMVSIATTDNCAWDGSILSFVAGGECVATVTASRRGYARLSEEFRVTPDDASFTLTWAGYANGNAATYGADAPALTDPTIAPVLEGAVYVYSAAGDGCEVDAETGALTILGADVADTRSCTVTVTATHSGYSEQTASQTVAIARAAQADLSVTNPYGGVQSLATGGTLAIVTAPTGGIGNLVYEIKAGGAGCTVDADGTVTGASSTGTCVVQARWDGDENTNPSTDQDIATITVVAAASPDPVWISSPYGGNAVVGQEVTPPDGFISNLGSGVGAPQFKSQTPQTCSIGEDNGRLTGLGAGTDICIVEARFVGNSSTAASAWVASPTISIAKGPHPEPADNSSYYGTSAQVALGETLALLEAPVGGGEATYSVKNGSESHCSVDGASGAITGLDQGSCTIQVAFAGDDNYYSLSAADLQTVTVVDGNQQLTLDAPYGESPSLSVGGTLALVNEPTIAAGANPGGALSYRAAPASAGVCSVGAGDGVVTGESVGDCTVQVQGAAVTDYVSTVWTEVATIPVSEGTLNIDWTPQPEGRFGAQLVLTAAVDNTGGAVIEYAVADAGDTGCAFGAARTLSFTATGICRVKATATKEHYGDWEREHPIIVRPGLITLTDTSDFGNPLKVGGQNRRPTGYTGLNPADAVARWQLVRGEDDCELVDAALGWVKGLPEAFIDDEDPVCSIQVVARKENYALFKSEPVNNRMLKGDLGTLTEPVFGFGSTQLSVGGFLEMTAPPTEDGNVPVTFAFEAAGADSGGSAKEDVCTVEASGRVSAGVEAQAEDTCTITTTVSSLGYNDKSPDPVVLTLKGTASFPAVPTFSYSSNLKMGETAALAPDATGMDTLGGTVTWNYYVTGPCTVVAADGQLSLGGDAHAGDECLVSARGVSSGNADYITEAVRVAVEKGDLDFASGGTDPANYTGRHLRLGGFALPVIPAGSQDDNSVAVSWGSWRVEGFDPGADPNDPSDDVPKDDVCSVDEEGVVRAGEAAAVADVCKVYAVASNPDYVDTDSLYIDTLTVESRGTLGVLTPPTYTEDLVVRGYPVAIATAPSAEVDAEGIVWTYREFEGSRGGTPMENICSVGENDGVVAVGSAAMLGDACDIVASAVAPGYDAGDAAAVTLNFHDTFTAISLEQLFPAVWSRGGECGFER